MRKHGDLQMSVLKVLWKIQEGEEEIYPSGINVKDFRTRFNKGQKNYAYNTLKTTLDRLYEKKNVSRRKIGSAYYYKALKTRKEQSNETIEKIVYDYFENDHKKMIEFCATKYNLQVTIN